MSAYIQYGNMRKRFLLKVSSFRKNGFSFRKKNSMKANYIGLFLPWETKRFLHVYHCCETSYIKKSNSRTLKLITFNRPFLSELNQFRRKKMILDHIPNIFQTPTRERIREYLNRLLFLINQNTTNNKLITKNFHKPVRITLTTKWWRDLHKQQGRIAANRRWRGYSLSTWFERTGLASSFFLDPNLESSNYLININRSESLFLACIEKKIPFLRAQTAVTWFTDLF